MGVALLPDWVSELSLQQQAVLVLALRGPDGFPKLHPVKDVLYRYRACLLKNAKTGQMLLPGQKLPSFMWHDFNGWDVILARFREIEDELPLHFYTHLMHGAQVLAYKHPSSAIRQMWYKFYKQCCDYLHTPVESRATMDERLNDFGRMEAM
jgi:hypothetical protein